MIYKCPQCAELFAAETAPLAQCANCNTLLRVMPVATKAPEVVVIEGPLWEEALPIHKRFIGTFRQITKSAPGFFFGLGEKASPNAEWFAYIASLIGIAGYFAIQLAFLSNIEPELQKFLQEIAATSDRHVRPHGVGKLFAWGFALSPFLAFIPAHLAAGLYQAGLFLLGQRNQGYDATFRVAAYGLAPMVLLAVPSIGVFIAPGWILALHWIGMTTAHRLPLGVTLMSIVLPIMTFFFMTARVLGQGLLLILTQP